MQAAIILLCALFGCIFRPIQPITVTVTKDEDTPAEKGSLLGDGLPVVYTRPLPEGRFAYSVPNSSHNTWMGASPNTQYPTAAEVFRGSGHNLERRPSNQSGLLTHENIQTTTKKLEQLSKIQKRLAGQMTPEDTIHAPRFPIPHHELNTVGEAAEEDETENGTLLTGEQKTTQVVPTSAPVARPRSHTVSGRRPNESGSRQGSRRGTLTDGTRPMYRDDIFFTGSLVRIPQYQSTTSLGYHMSVTRLPTTETRTACWTRTSTGS